MLSVGTKNDKLSNESLGVILFNEEGIIKTQHNANASAKIKRGNTFTATEFLRLLFWLVSLTAMLE
jgi:hypothetical protein